jgi:hypothetical protein
MSLSSAPQEGRKEVSSHFHDLFDDALTAAYLYSIKWQDDQ